MNEKQQKALEKMQELKAKIKKTQEADKSTVGISTYKEIEENKDFIESLLDEYKEMSKPHKFSKTTGTGDNKKTVKYELNSVERVPLDVMQEMFNLFNKSLFNKGEYKHYSQQVARINSSLTKHKLGVINAKKGRFRIIYKE